MEPRRSPPWWSVTGRLVLPALAVLLSLGGCSGSGRPAAPGPSSTESPTLPPARTSSGQPTTLADVTVPDVVGKNYAVAQMQMATTGTYGLYVKYRFVHSSTALAGRVITQSPGAGATAKPGVEVTLRVSIGPANVPGSGPCQAGALRARPGTRVSEATGQHTLDVSLTNISASTCVLEGYPVVKLLDARGRALGFRYSHRADQMTTGAKPSPVYLPPKAEAWARINKYRCDIATTDVAYSVVLELPRHGADVSMTKSQYPIFDYCQEAANLSVAVSPFEPVEAFLWPSWG